MSDTARIFTDSLFAFLAEARRSRAEGSASPGFQASADHLEASAKAAVAAGDITQLEANAHVARSRKLYRIYGGTSAQPTKDETT